MILKLTHLGTRKLACSKNPDGCERCKREGIVCHYSEQKPMGRPRKRQFIETVRDDPEPDPILDSLDLGPLPFVADDYDYTEPTQPCYTDKPTVGFSDVNAKAVGDDNGDIWRFGDPRLVGTNQINFENFGFDDTFQADQLQDVPMLVPAADSSPSENDSTPPQTSVAPSGSVAPCSCLASMYLALASLQLLPTDVVSGLRTIRTAAATAATTIWCPQCGSVILEQKRPPMDAFQNTMLLGTLLPIIAHGYQKLIDMVDAEANAAQAAGETKTFDFQEYGGLCVNQTTMQGEMACLEKEMMFTPVEMPPMQWRSTIRALLRVDIYGHDGTGYKYKGLKGLVTEIETRQKARHDWVGSLSEEEMKEISATGPFSSNKPAACLGEQTHGCLQILEMARLALDNLVIA